MAPRVLAAEFRVILAEDGAPQMAVIHSTGRTAAYDSAALASLLSPEQAAALRSILARVHESAEACIKSALQAEYEQLMATLAAGE